MEFDARQLRDFLTAVYLEGINQGHDPGIKGTAASLPEDWGRKRDEAVRRYDCAEQEFQIREYAESLANILPKELKEGHHRFMNYVNKAWRRTKLAAKFSNLTAEEQEIRKYRFLELLLSRNKGTIKTLRIPYEEVTNEASRLWIENERDKWEIKKNSEEGNNIYICTVRIHNPKNLTEVLAGLETDIFMDVDESDDWDLKYKGIAYKRILKENPELGKGSLVRFLAYGKQAENAVGRLVSHLESVQRKEVIVPKGFAFVSDWYVN